MGHRMMTQEEYKKIVLDATEPEPIPTLDQLLDSVSLPTMSKNDLFRQAMKAKQMKTRAIDITLSGIAPPPKSKKWIPCPECGDPRCSLGYWE